MLASNWLMRGVTQADSVIRKIDRVVAVGVPRRVVGDTGQSGGPQLEGRPIANQVYKN